MGGVEYDGYVCMCVGVVCIHVCSRCVFLYMLRWQGPALTICRTGFGCDEAANLLCDLGQIC